MEPNSAQPGALPPQTPSDFSGIPDDEEVTDAAPSH